MPHARVQSEDQCGNGAQEARLLAEEMEASKPAGLACAERSLFSQYPILNNFYLMPTLCGFRCWNILLCSALEEKQASIAFSPGLKKH
jgi:hypothetical protein